MGCSDTDFGWLTFKKVFIDIESYFDYELEVNLKDYLKNGGKVQDIPGGSAYLEKYEELYQEDEVENEISEKDAREASEKLNARLKAAKTLEERQLIINETFARGEKR